jgi:hypothetical protein
MPDDVKEILYYMAVIWGTIGVMLLIGKLIELLS